MEGTVPSPFFSKLKAVKFHRGTRKHSGKESHDFYARRRGCPPFSEPGSKEVLLNFGNFYTIFSEYWELSGTIFKF